MARIANETPALARGQTEQYPYGQWLDGNKWELSQGAKGQPNADFTCSLDGMASALKKAAARRSIKVQVSIDYKNHLVFVQALSANEQPLQTIPADTSALS